MTTNVTKTLYAIELRNNGRRALVRSIVQEIDENAVLISADMETVDYVAHSHTVMFKDNRIQFLDTVFAGTRIKFTVSGRTLTYSEDDLDAAPVERKETRHVDYTFTEDWLPQDAAGIIAGEIGLADVVKGYEEIDPVGQDAGLALVLEDFDGNPVVPTGKGLDFPPSTLPDDVVNLLQESLQKFGVA